MACQWGQKHSLFLMATIYGVLLRRRNLQPFMWHVNAVKSTFDLQKKKPLIFASPPYSGLKPVTLMT